MIWRCLSMKRGSIIVADLMLLLDSDHLFMYEGPRV
jgi:hypothetical protein